MLEIVKKAKIAREKNDQLVKSIEKKKEDLIKTANMPD